MTTPKDISQTMSPTAPNGNVIPAGNSNDVGNEASQLTAPSISLPKGGGAIKGIDEKFSVNAVNGTSSFSIPVPVSPARGFSPSLALNYNSGSGNSSFGLGWSLSLPSIKRKTEKELPQYIDDMDSDTFLISDAEDLVPEFKKDNAGNFILDVNGDYVINDYDENLGGTAYRVRSYRPRIEGLFSKIQRWTEKSTGYIHWRVITKNNVTSIYGKTPAARIADPSKDKRIFEWFLQFTYDDKGNCALYEYKPEDGVGINASSVHNKNRINGNAPFANTYLKRIYSGIHLPYTQQGEIFPAPADFFFETVFNYGEHSLTLPFNEAGPWSFRSDAFSTYRSGFEIRNCRLCSSVILCHHFNELPGGSAVIKSLSLSYDNNGEDGFCFLKEVIMTGYTKQDDGTYTQKSLPPFSFTYQKHNWDTEVKTIEPGALQNLPIGIDESRYQFVDLYSEGLSGILTEQGSGWFYKHNWGQGRFTPAKMVMPRPSFSGLSDQLQLIELEADGTRQLVNWKTEPKGFFELTADEDWTSFTSFHQLPNIDLRNPNIRLVDLNGDGRAEVLLTEQEVFTWYPSEGKNGYGYANKVLKSYDEEKGPSIVFSDEMQSIFLADMTGDGMQDIVRIKNGSVSYWPNLGYGRFGAKVTMDHAPRFDSDDQFDAAYIKLADIDGSGTTDIIYLGKTQCNIWLNQQGNAFLTGPRQIEYMPPVNQHAKINFIDLLGTGLSCMVWSSALPADQDLPLKYVDLLDSKKPHIMIGYKNNMGKEVEVEYTPSTKFYIDDQLVGQPWVTKLHFPVHCVSRIITYDRILKTRFASEYTYHHGYYDHMDKEFRGFGRVDQKDSEDISNFILQGGTNANVEEDLHQPSVLTKTWFHTGAFLDREKILNQFSHEYFQNTAVPENLLPEPELPSSISIAEYRQCLRAFKGTLLRKEVFALDATPQQGLPYLVEQHNSLVKVLQPQGKNKHAVCFAHESEGITYQYERNPSDPRTAHSFVFDVDDYGNVLSSASVVYPRKTNPLPAPEQVQLHITYSQKVMTNAVDQNLNYRTPLAHFSKTFEVTGAPVPATYFTLSDLRTHCINAATIDYEATHNGTLQKRLIKFKRNQYRADDAVTILPLGTIQSKALSHQTFRAAFNNAMLNTVFSPKITLANLSTLLTDPAKGAYIFADNYYWIQDSICKYDTLHFYLSTLYSDPFGNETHITYDPYFLFIAQTSDALNNTNSVQTFNYRTLKPLALKDANDNVTAVRFDELGFVVKSFTIGKKGLDAGDAFDDAKIEIHGAADYPGSVMEYSVSEWYNQTLSSGFDLTNYKPQPNFVNIRTRETHYYADLLHQTKWQESYVYSDGSGRIVLKKEQAEPGLALIVNPDGTVNAIDTMPNRRWIGNGRTIVNNKGNAVKQYEPYFSATPSFDDEKEMVQLGVTPIIRYDALGRPIQKDNPDHTFNKTEFTPWLRKDYDANDTVRDSGWYITMGSPNPMGPEPSDPDERSAWLAAKHYDTPAITHYDTLGRIFLAVANDGNIDTEIRAVFDISGNVLQIIDGLGRTSISYYYDMQGNRLMQTGMDTGRRWNLNHTLGKPLISWDDRGHQFTNDYDALLRPTSLWVEEAGVNILFHRTDYGESVALPLAKAANLRGKITKEYQPHGITENKVFDFKGNLLSRSFQLVEDYKNRVDWTNPASVALVNEVFLSAGEFDALNRATKIITPHKQGTPSNELLPFYNEGSVLQNLDVKIRGAAETTFISNINYNAKRQRETIFYGNQTKTAYSYDPETFRLIRLFTTRNSGAILQDIAYNFDPVGNITRIKDSAKADLFFDGELIKAVNKYEYDALYRLTKATGRKHAGQTDLNYNGVGNPPNYRNHPFGNAVSINPNDAQAFCNYTERYSYDRSGNLLEQRHTAKNSSWTRTFEYDHGNNLSNHLTATTIGADTFHYNYDAHGNMSGLETVLNEVWDFLDQLRQVDLGGGGTAYYVYDSSGNRMRKIIERPDGTIKERIYLGAVEMYREYDATATLTLERDTLSIMTDTQRIAMVDTPVIKPAGSAEMQLIRYQYHDQLDSSSIELDELANIISNEEYFPFGTTSFTTIDASREVAAKRYRYTAKERDEESGLNYHGARYYAAWLCRWTKADPAGINAGLNLYIYVQNNPVMMNDPTGMDGETCGVWDEEAQVCYAEPCSEQNFSSASETPSSPPPVPLPPRVRYVPRRIPQPPPPPQPAPIATEIAQDGGVSLMSGGGSGGYGITMAAALPPFASPWLPNMLRAQAREGAIDELVESVESGIYNERTLYTAERFTPDELVDLAENGVAPEGMEFSHYDPVSSNLESAADYEQGVLTDSWDHLYGDHGGDYSQNPREFADRNWETNAETEEMFGESNMQVVDAEAEGGMEYLGMTDGEGAMVEGGQVLETATTTTEITETAVVSTEVVETTVVTTEVVETGVVAAEGFEAADLLILLFLL